MISLKYFISLIVVTFLSTLVFLGCETKRYTTKFEVTPFMEDGVTRTEVLSGELSDELRMEDEKRMKTLQQEAEERKKSEEK